MSFLRWMSDAGGSPSMTQASLLIGLVVLSISLWLLLPSRAGTALYVRVLGGLFGLTGLAVIWALIPRLDLTDQTAFCVLATLTIVSAVATIASRSPVQSAIWFAASLLGTAGLMLFQGAQFLGLATVAVYAGAIVVTFLFVLMLAQPGGHAYFDRMSWGAWPRYVASVVAVCFLVVIAACLTDIENDDRAVLRARLESVLTDVDSTARVRALHWPTSAGELSVRVAVPVGSRDQVLARSDDLQRVAQEVLPGDDALRVSLEFVDILTPNHVAHLGGQLFGRHLFAVQIAAALLLVALVGAIAISGRDTDTDEGRKAT